MEVDPSMASEPEETGAAVTFRLSCSDCEFETTVEGSADAAIDAARAHRRDASDPGHFVDFEFTGK